MLIVTNTMKVKCFVHNKTLKKQHSVRLLNGAEFSEREVIMDHQK